MKGWQRPPVTKWVKNEQLELQDQKHLYSYSLPSWKHHDLLRQLWQMWDPSGGYQLAPAAKTLQLQNSTNVHHCCSFPTISQERPQGVWPEMIRFRGLGRLQRKALSASFPGLHRQESSGAERFLEYSSCDALLGWPPSCQEAKSLDLCGQERVDDEHKGLRAAVKVQLLAKGKRNKKEENN